MQTNVPYFAMVKKIKKCSGIYIADPDLHRKLITSRGSPLAVPAKFGRRPFPRSSVILFTEWQNEWQSDWPNDHITYAFLAEVKIVTVRLTDKINNWVAFSNHLRQMNDRVFKFVLVSISFDYQWLDYSKVGGLNCSVNVQLVHHHQLDGTFISRCTCSVKYTAGHENGANFIFYKL